QLAGDWDQTRISQGMSGINEGIAAALGLPIDALTGAVNLTTGGMNWLGDLVGLPPETSIPRIDNPVGGSQWLRQFGEDQGLIRADPQTDAGAFWRRAGQSVGAASVPGF